MRRSFPIRSYRPAQEPGNLYYVRLKTPAGLLYKLGYTILPSVQNRMAFAGKGHERLIDKVLFIHWFEDAAEMEYQLHKHFYKKAAFNKTEPNPFGPLYQAGQSELYADDILSMDDSCTSEQVNKTKYNIAQTYPSPHSEMLDAVTAGKMKAQDRLVGSFSRFAAILLAAPFITLSRIWTLIFDRNQSTANRKSPSLLQIHTELKEMHERELRERYDEREPPPHIVDIIRRIMEVSHYTSQSI